MEEFLKAFAADPADFIPYTALVLGFIIAIAWLFLATIESIVKTRSRERSRREMAAYVAEGSLTPEQAEKILVAEPKDSSAIS